MPPPPNLGNTCPSQPQIPPSVVSYNTALGACEATGDVRLALELLGHMTDVNKRVTPDLWSYNIVLSTCARAGEWSIVESLLAEMNLVLGRLDDAREQGMKMDWGGDILDRSLIAITH